MRCLFKSAFKVLAGTALTIPVFLQVLSSPLHAQTAPDNRPSYDATFFEPTEAVVTPHIPWAKPYAKGPVRALFITHRNAMREVIEIAQRLQMQYTVFAAEKPEQFDETGAGIDNYWKAVRGNNAAELTADLMNKLRADYDVIVFGNLSWSVLPVEARYEILRKVKAGTGLCGVLPGRDEYIGRLLPTRELGWGFNLWSGAANGDPNWLGKGVFQGEVDHDIKHSGDGSVRITGTEAIPGSRETPRAAYVQANIPLEKNARYRFSVWYRTKNLPDGKAVISFYPLGSAALKASTEWKEFSTTLEAKEHKDFGIYLSNYGVGDVWYDDAKLTREGSETNLLRNPELEIARSAQTPEFVTNGVPFTALPAFARWKTVAEFAGATVQTGEFGRGRICVLNGLNLPRTQAWAPAISNNALETKLLDYDYYLSLPLRMILWSARKEPDTKIQAPAATQIAREKGGALKFAISSLPAPKEINATFILRDRENRVLRRMENSELTKGESNAAWLATFSLPKIPAGNYFVDLLLRKNGATVNWASAAVEVTSSQRIAELTLSKTSFSQQGAVSGTVKLNAAVPSNRSVRVRQFDNYRRLVAASTLKATGTTITFSLKSSPALSVLQHIEASLVAGDEVLDTASATFSIHDFFPPRDDIRWIMWDSMDPHSFTGHTIAREFAKHGIDTQYTSFSPWALRTNMWDLPYITRFVDEKTNSYSETAKRDKDDLVRVPCLTDPQFRRALREELLKKTRAVSPFSTLEYSLGDENSFVLGRYDLCFSPTCNADFIQWARREYQNDLSKLNASHGTQHTSWEQVRPMTLENARKLGRYAAWVDHRRHMETVWAGIHAYAREVIREVVPQARVGYEGSDTQAGAFHAADYWKLMRVMDLNSIYFSDFQAAAVRDFAQPNTMFGAGWYGGYPNNRNETFMHWFPWMALLNGANSYWVWNGSGSAGSVMSFDASLYPFFAANTREMQEIKNGTGKLLMHAPRQHDAVAILWSPSSVHAREFTPNMPDIDDALNSTVRLLNDLNLQPRILSNMQLAQLNTRNFKVLFLIEAQALSDAEVAAITRFVREGGTVIADLRPGVRDEHGNPRAKNALDELFGVRQNVEAPALQMTQRLPEISTSKLKDLPHSIIDASLRLNGGKSEFIINEIPFRITHQTGKGRTILFNLSWSDYIKRERTTSESPTDFAFWPVNEQWRTLLRDAMKVAPPVDITPVAPRVQIARFRAGNLEYVGIMPSLPRGTNLYGAITNAAKLPPPKNSTIRFARAAHVYDVRAGKYLGQTAQIKTNLQSGRARLFALLPYRVSAMKVLARPATKNAANVQLAIVPSAAKAGRHIARVRFFGPDKKERAFYRRNVKLENGRADFTHHFAMNDQAGIWTLDVQDVASGVRSKTTMRVAAR